jgi:hypothetical protein
MTKQFVWVIKTKIQMSEIATIVSDLVGRKLDLHYSEFFGGDYYRAGIVGETEIYLFPNYNAFYQEYEYTNHRNFDFVLRIDEPDRNLNLEKVSQSLQSYGSVLRLA